MASTKPRPPPKDGASRLIIMACTNGKMRPMTYRTAAQTSVSRNGAPNHSWPVSIATGGTAASGAT
jgi:hypothetical protein